MCSINIRFSRPLQDRRDSHMSLPLWQVSPEEADALEARLRGINSMAQIVRAQRAAVGVDYVLGVGGFDLDRVEGEVQRP